MRTLAFVLLLGGVSLGCGPSVQVIHEGGVRFEHCYRLDLDHSIANSHRAACWKTWRTRYSYGQSRDRLEYADRRLEEIKKGEPPPALQLDASRRPLATDAPIDAHAPPPKVAESGKPAARAEIATAEGTSDASKPKSEAEEHVPGDACARNCRNERELCLDTCDASDPQPCRCEASYRECMKNCFE